MKKYKDIKFEIILIGYLYFQDYISFYIKKTNT